MRQPQTTFTPQYPFQMVGSGGRLQNGGRASVLPQGQCHAIGKVTMRGSLACLLFWSSHYSQGDS